MGHNISNLRSGKKRIGEQKQMIKQSILKVHFYKMGHSDNYHSPEKSKNSDGYRQGKD
jgi:hypothetical protein